MDIRQVTVITRNPSGDDPRDMGACAEGWYFVEGDTLTMCSADGAPLRDANTGERVTARLADGESAVAIAKRMTLRAQRRAW